MSVQGCPPQRKELAIHFEHAHLLRGFPFPFVVFFPFLVFHELLLMSRYSFLLEEKVKMLSHINYFYVPTCQ